MRRHSWLDVALAALLLGCASVFSYPQRIQKRTTTAPFIADALGNSLPPPAELPATVGSPSNLLTPDRYEFYTFDETGELVKRLMTLDEIQAIVAAGDGNDGHMVTFAQDDKPTIAFNFSQPPFTKVHSVVANVQNVLKSQMEAQKKNPPAPTSFDTPDVSNSWSMILPSIFGNTGVDIVPDKIPTSFGTPETDTIDDGQMYSDNKVSSKEDPDEDLPSNTKDDQLLHSDKTNLEEHKHSTEITATEKTTSSSVAAITTKPIIFTSRPSSPVALVISTSPSTTISTPSTNRPPTTSSTTLTVRPLTTEAKPLSTANTLSTITAKIPAIANKQTTTETRTSTTTTRISTNATRTSTTSTVPSKNIHNSFKTTQTPYITPHLKTSTVFLNTTQRLSPTATKTSITPNHTTLSTLNIKPEPEKVSSTYTTPSTTKQKSTSRPLQTVSHFSPNTAKPTTTFPKSTVTVSTTKKPTPSLTSPLSTTTFKIQEVKSTEATFYPTKISISEKNPENNEETRIPEKLTSTTTIFSKNSHASPSTTTETIYVEITKPKITTQPYSIPKNTPKVTTPKVVTKSESDIYYVPLITTNTFSSSVLSTENFEKVALSTNSLFKDVSAYDTTVTTQSPAPISTRKTLTLAVNEVTSAKPNIIEQSIIQNNTQEELSPIFDVAQSISQIASDLGNSFVDKNENLEAEIKESTGFDLPDGTSTDKLILSKYDSDFIKIPTSDPDNTKSLTTTQRTNLDINQNKVGDSAQPLSQKDDILSESMSTVLSQVKDNGPKRIFNTNNSSSSTELLLNLNQIVESTTPIALTHQNNIHSQKDIISNNTNFDSLNPSNINIKDTEITITASPIIGHDPTTPKNLKKDTTTEKIRTSDGIIDTKNTDPIKINDDSKLFVSDSNNNLQNVANSKTNTIFENKNKPEIAIQNDEGKSSIQGNFNSSDNLNQTKILHDKSESGSSTTIKTNKPLSNITEKLEVKETFSVENKDANKISIKESFLDTKKKIQKVNIEEKEYATNKTDSWKLVSTVSPPKSNISSNITDQTLKPSSQTNIIFDNNKESSGLEITTKNLSEDVYRFIELCNELAFRYWSAIVQNIDNKRSFVLSPYSITSMLAMMFMGARGATSGEMNDILKLDDMVTFNPHFVLKNVSDSIDNAHDSGVGVSAFVKELYSDRNSGKLLTFYKERAQHFYSGHVEEINFKSINDIIRRRTNLLIKRYTWGKINEFMKTDDISMKPPLAAFSANIFETDCSNGGSMEGRDGEMYFAVSPSVRQRRLIPVPAVTFRKGFLAGYEPALDATAVALGSTSIVSTIFLMPGQQGNAVRADDLERLESRLLEATSSGAAWSTLLRTLHPRSGLELQLPRFAHRSLFNVSSALRSMGLRDIFEPDLADLAGLSGPSHSLHLSDMMETTAFANCGDPERHSEVYPEPGTGSKRRRRRWDEPRDYQRAFHDPHDLGSSALLPLHLRPRQARLPASSQPVALRFDRPFLYLVRHNPTGMIIYVGRYNPRLLP